MSGQQYDDLPPLHLGPETLLWAGALIDSADGPIPRYGTPEWAALPETSRAKVAACVIAAEAWRSYWDPREVATRTRLEIAGAQLDQEPELWTSDVVEAVHRQASQPSYAELSRLRGEPDAEARANAHRHRMGLPVDERPSAKCEDDQHDWALYTITTDWPQDTDRPQYRRCRRCLAFGRRILNSALRKVGVAA